MVRAAVMTAPVVTIGAVSVGVAAAAGVGSAATTAAPTSAPRSTAVAPSTRSASKPLTATIRTKALSRATDRLRGAATEGDKARTKVARFATDSLNLRRTAADKAEVVDVIAPRTKLNFTGVTNGRYAEVSWRGDLLWVTAQYLAVERPAAPVASTPVTMGLSDAPCPDGGVENGLTDGAVRVYRAVCHNFPQIVRYGGYAARGEHASGKAIDIMTSDVGIGTQIADFLRAHASELGLYDVIWRQRIWTPVRSSEGWRSMPSRGSATANHFDHVHVSVN